MRRLIPRLIPLALLLAAACGRAPSTPGLDSTAFDPNSAENTLAWATSLRLKYERTPEGNAPAREEAAKKIQAEVDAAVKGKAIRWSMRVASVGHSLSCQLSSPEMRNLPQDPVDGKPRRSVLPVVYKRPTPIGDPPQPPLTYFQSSPPQGEWLRTLATGDRVILVGAIADISCQRGDDSPRGEWTETFVVILADAHLEKP